MFYVSALRFIARVIFLAVLLVALSTWAGLRALLDPLPPDENVWLIKLVAWIAVVSYVSGGVVVGLAFGWMSALLEAVLDIKGQLAKRHRDYDPLGPVVITPRTS